MYMCIDSGANITLYDFAPFLRNQSVLGDVNRCHLKTVWKNCAFYFRLCEGHSIAYLLGEWLSWTIIRIYIARV